MTSEAAPTSLNDLFEKDPLDLTQSDLETIVARLREARTAFNLKEEKPKKAAKTKIDTTDLDKILGI